MKNVLAREATVNRDPPTPRRTRHSRRRLPIVAAVVAAVVAAMSGCSTAGPAQLGQMTSTVSLVLTAGAVLFTGVAIYLLLAVGHAMSEMVAMVIELTSRLSRIALRAMLLAIVLGVITVLILKSQLAP
jgi:hypothetical protein